MATYYNPIAPGDGLVLALDAKNPKSYPGTGNTWYNLVDGVGNATKQGSTGLSTWNSNGYFEHRPSNYFGATNSSSSAPNSGGCWWEVPSAGSLSPGGSGWSVGGWLRVIGDQTGNGTGWFHKQGSGDERGIHLEPIGGTFRANGTNGWSQINYNINNTGVWAHYFFVFTQTSGTYGTDTGNLKFYVNGSLVVEDTAFTPRVDNTGASIYLGRRNGHLRHFLNGDISSYYYYRSSLSANNVYINFSSTRERFGI